MPSSPTDDLKSLEVRVVTRIRQLQPALREMDELREVAQRLGIDPDAVNDAPEASGRRGRRRSPAGTSGPRSGSKAVTGRSRDNGAPGARRTGRRPPRSASAARGTRAQEVATLVRERPGITVAELGAALGVDATSLYRVVHQLEADGTLRKEGRALLPIGAASA